VCLPGLRLVVVSVGGCTVWGVRSSLREDRICA
jgi:hypothetical protein